MRKLHKEVACRRDHPLSQLMYDKREIEPKRMTRERKYE